LFDLVVFVEGQAVFPDDGGSNGSNGGGGHMGKLYCRISWRDWVEEF
jgi:hypothetical protein